MIEIEELKKRNLKEDKKISITLMSSFAVLTIQYLILVMFNLIGTSIGGSIQLLSKAIVGLFFLLALPSVLKRSKVKFIGIYFVTIITFLFNFLIFKDNIPYIKTIIFPFFFMCLPSFVYAYSIDDWNILKDVMKKTSFIVFVVGTIIGVLVFSGSVSIGSYSMSLSYYMLLPAVIYMNDFLDKITFKSAITLFISLLIILALGARGPIMCVGVFTILKIINMKKKINRKTILIYILIIGLIMMLFIFLEDILEFAYNTLMKFGIHSRSIRLFLKDELHLSSRDKIYEDVILGIKNNPILGVGLAGDRRIIDAVYAHNIIIEILANFGVIIGSFFILFLIIISIKTLFSKNKKVANFMIIWFSIGFIHLMVSSSFLIDFKFWIFLGLVLKATFYSNKNIL